MEKEEENKKKKSLHDAEFFTSETLAQTVGARVRTNLWPQNLSTATLCLHPCTTCHIRGQQNEAKQQAGKQGR